MEPDAPSADISRLQRKLLREVKAREEAERLLEVKSAELYEVAERSRILVTAIESSADGMALTDDQGNFTYMNATHALMFGYDLPELIGKPWSVLYKEDELKRFETDIMPEFGKDGQWQGDTIGLHKNGSRRYFIVRDIEVRLQEAERAATVVTLGRTIAHDLNNLLAAISGYSMILQSDLLGNDAALERAKRIENAAQQAVDVVQSLESKAPNEPLSIQTTELSKLINTTVQIAKGIRPKRVTMELDLDENIFVETNSILLSRCLLNILKNAMEAMPDGGAIHIKTQTDITLPEDEKGEYLSLGYPVGRCQGKIEITDSGTGMTPNVLEKILDPFFSTKKKDIGRGLGLQSLKTLAEEELAYIRIESVLGQGTSFSVYLMEPPEEMMSLQEDVTAETNFEQTSILLVEDDEMVGDMLGTTLFRMGYHVVWEKNPLEALKVLDDKEFDLVITDYNMPHMTGDLLAQSIKAKVFEMPIIIYSGQASEITPSSNYTTILKKPILPDQLESAINSAVKN